MAEFQMTLPELPTAEEAVRNLQAILDYDEDSSHAGVKAWKASFHLGTPDGSTLVSFDALFVDPAYNPRPRDEKFWAKVREIALSIKENGYLPFSTLIVKAVHRGKKPVLELRGGFTRHEAILLARTWGVEIEYVPVNVLPASMTREDEAVALFQEGDGTPLPPFGRAIWVKRLHGWNMPVSVIAIRCGITEDYALDLLKFAGSPQSIRDMVESGATTVAVALKTIGIHGGDAPAVLEKALAKAKSAGHTKLTNKHLPGVALKKSITKSAPRLYSAVQEVASDPSYSTLDASLREKIDILLEELLLIAQAQQDAQASADAEDSPTN